MNKRIYQTIRKCIAGLLSGILFFAPVGQPVAFAQEETPPPTQTETTVTPTPQSDVAVNNADTTNTTNSDTQANTGENALTEEETPTPTQDTQESTPTQTLTETETPTPTYGEEATGAGLLAGNEATGAGLLAGNEATTSANIAVNTNTGGNSSENTGGSLGGSNSSSSSSTPTPSPTTMTLSTGNSVAVTFLDNTVNATSVNSEVVYHTINLYANETGTIDLTLPSELATLLIQEQPNNEEINALFSVNNSATVNNTVTVESETGSNTASGSGTVTITTGDAVALLSLLNRINFVMVDSVLHIAVINIFGNFTGNILLPNLLSQFATPCDACGATTVANSADVTTNATVTADTGNNTATGSGTSIETGNAYGAVKLFDFINTLIYGSQHTALYITNLGEWNGQFLGWADETGTTASGSVIPFAQCSTCIGDTNITNQAKVTNTITLSADTGNNTAIAAGNANIQTGSAFAMANIINFVNTTLIRSFGFFGFINIFGSWTGDIGSKSLFPEPTPAVGGAEVMALTSESSSAKEGGGKLAVATSNNVGSYVLPGDTVTLFATVKNPGSGMVYDTKMIIMLIKDKTEVQTAVIPVGNIQAGRSMKFSSGLVLSNTAPAGTYTIRVAAYGFTGPLDTKISAWAESQFDIYGSGSGSVEGAVTSVGEPVFEAPSQVMGVTTRPHQNPNILLALFILLLLVPEYYLFKALKDKELVSLILTPAAPAFARLRALHLLLL